ncbi:hypothetical protein LNQ81_11655 [Myroides sp. M-43]|uniref:hypothetical protein n=1 Tax=Myroides oncorhynchi TaxID=2893756 RepID=UPI001E3CFBB4|nr:hypothetical protein [Myroides oncorhynchi]MCC9043326.1 hypothetical protein [Myroides oncorhynchi]
MNTLKHILVASCILSLTTIFSQELKDKDSNLLISELFQKEQDICKRCETLSSNPNSDQKELSNCYIAMSKIDSENQQLALPLLDSYLNKQISLNNESLSNLYYIIQHAGGETQGKYKNFISDLFTKQIITNQEYAWFTDRLNVRNNKAQTFGFQVKYWSDTQDTLPYPIDINAEKNASQIGLESSKQYMLESYTNEYSPQYITKEEFVLFGHIKNSFDTSITHILINNKEKVSINNKGFLSYWFSFR